MNSYIVEFGAGNAAGTISLGRGGGKAVNLVRLAGRGFPVPPGFVCTTDAYRAVVTANSLDGVIEAALHGLHGTDPA
ncbi:MAG TPA: PEP/pyruvate-binding domain-containing protein, partial [Propionibacteriaceae bacterium]